MNIDLRIKRNMMQELPELFKLRERVNTSGVPRAGTRVWLTEIDYVNTAVVDPHSLPHIWSVKIVYLNKQSKSRWKRLYTLTINYEQLKKAFKELEE